LAPDREDGMYVALSAFFSRTKNISSKVGLSTEGIRLLAQKQKLGFQKIEV
jgi:hypothetical protein